MATVIAGGQVKKDDGTIITPQQGGWYDGQQYWGGTLSAPGQINTQSNQQGAGQQVSNEVIAQTNPNNVAYIANKQKTYTPAQNVVPNQQPAFSDAGMAGAGASGGGAIAPQPTLDLQALYETEYQNSGVKDLQAELSTKEKAYIEAQNTINNNAWLSEATRVGRLEKLSQQYEQRTANIRNDIETKKADIETKINIALKQFDINSQAAQNALTQFNTLLTMGALDGASATDIANITRSTGLSSSAVSSAIQANKTSKYQTTIQSYDDGINQGFRVLTIDGYGNIVNSQNEVVGKSDKALTSGISLSGQFSNQASDWEVVTDTNVNNTGDISQGWDLINGGGSW